MSEEQKTLTQQIVEFQDGKYDSPDVKTQCDAGWYDWFCKDTSLRNKTAKLYPKVIQIVNTNKINTDECYVFFKNNCPCAYPLYDSFSICDIKTGDVIFYVAPNSPHEKGAVVYAAPHFEEPAVVGKWKNVLEYFESL